MQARIGLVHLQEHGIFPVTKGLDQSRAIRASRRMVIRLLVNRMAKKRSRTSCPENHWRQIRTTRSAAHCSFMARSLAAISMFLAMADLRSSCAWMALSIRATSATLLFGACEKTLSVKVHDATLPSGVRIDLARHLDQAAPGVADHQLDAFKTSIFAPDSIVDRALAAKSIDRKNPLSDLMNRR